MKNEQESVQDLTNTETSEKILETSQSLTAVRDRELLVREIAALQSINEAVASKGRDEILQLIVDKAIEVMPGEYSSLWLLDPSTGDLVLQAMNRSKRGTIDQVSRQRSGEQSISMQVVKTGKARIIDDTMRETGFRRIYQEAQSSLVVPLKYRDNVIGVLDVQSSQLGAFATQHSLLLESFADQATIAIENAHHLEQERELRRQAEMLREISGAIGSERELKQVAERILDDLSMVIEYRKASLQLIREDGDSRVLLAARGFDEDTAARWFLRPVSEDRLVSRVVESGEPLILSEPSEDRDWGTLPGTADVKSWIGIPLIYNQEAIGFVTLDHDQSGFYTQADRDKLVVFAKRVAIDIRNLRLFDSAQRRIRDLNIINDIVRVISTKLDTEDLLQTVVSQIADQLNCTHCTYFSPQHEDGGVRLLVPQKTHGEGSERVMNRRFKTDEGLVGWVFRHGESLSLADAREDDRFSPAREAQDRPRSMLVAPVKVGDQVIGVISADRDEYGWFRESDRRLVDALAQQVGTAIQRSIGLDLLQDIGNQVVGRIQTVDEILQTIVSGAINLTNTTSGAIFLLSEDQQSIDMDYHYPPEFDPPPTRIEDKQGFTYRMVTNPKPVIISDINQDERVNPVFREHGILSFMGIPLVLDQKVIGVLYLFDTERHESSEIELSLLSTLASQAAIAIENARLYQSLERRIRELEALTEIGRTISYLGIDQLLDLVYEEMSKIINLSDAQVQFAFYDGIRDEISFPLAIERDNGEIIDVVRWSKREGQYGESDEDEIVAQFRPRARRDPPGLNEYVIHSQEPLLIVENLEQKANERGIQVWPTFGRLERPASSWLGVPMMVSGRVIGVISLHSLEREHAFDQDTVRMLTAIANQAAIAIENARLYNTLQRRVNDLEALNRVAGRISTSSERQGIYQTVVEEARATLDATRCTLFILDSDGMLTPQAAAGISFSMVSANRFPFGEGSVGWVAQEGQSVLVPDVAQDKRFILNVSSTAKAMVLAPLWGEGKVIGVISAEQDQVSAFDERDQMFLETLAVQAGVTIHQENQRRQRVDAVKSRLNPYIVGEPIRDPGRFFGRRKFLQDIMDRIHNNNFIIYGERRIGKTSLLIQLQYHLEIVSERNKDRYFLPVFVSLQGIPEGQFFNFLMTRIARAAMVLQNELVGWKSRTDYDHSEFEDDLEIVVRALQERHPDKEIRIVLLLDEMDQFINYQPIVHEQFRSLFMTRSGIHLKMILAGVSVQRVQLARTSPWYNLFMEMELQPLDEISARQLVEEPVLGYYTYDNEALRAILDCSNLKPQEVQRLAYLTVNVMLDRISTSVDKVGREPVSAAIVILREDVLKAAELALREKDGEYRALWYQFNDNQRQLLLDAMTRDGLVDSKAIRPGGASVFSREDLYNITYFDDQHDAHLTYLFMQWLEEFRS